MTESPSTTRELSYLVYRQDGLKLGPCVVVQAVVNDCITDAEELVDELRAGVTKWARQTENGRSCWEYAGTDMNLGDIMDYEDEILPYCPNIHSLQFVSGEVSSWHYDTLLCDDIEEDDYESSS